MSKLNYQRYLASREWGILKRQVRERSGGNCERGHVEPTKAAAVHHQTYERIGHEDLADLLHVCRPCHDFLSGEDDRDPLKAEADELDWGTSPWAPMIESYQVLLDWFAMSGRADKTRNWAKQTDRHPFGPPFMLTPALRGYIADYAAANGSDPKVMLQECISTLVNTEAGFDVDSLE